MVEGKHTVEAKRDDLVFDKLEVNITEETAELPDIQMKGAYVCGVVKTINKENDDYEVPKEPRTVRLL